MENVLVIGRGMQPVVSGDVVLGDFEGSFIRVTEVGEVYVNQDLVARDEKIYSSLRMAIGFLADRSREVL